MTSRSGESRDRSVAAGYAVAVIACVTAAAAQYFLRPLFGERFPLAALPAVVVVAAWFGGFGPGLLATVGGTLAGAYVFSRPDPRLQMDDLEQRRIAVSVHAGRPADQPCGSTAAPTGPDRARSQGRHRAPARGRRRTFSSSPRRSCGPGRRPTSPARAFPTLLHAVDADGGCGVPDLRRRERVRAGGCRRARPPVAVAARRCPVAVDSPLDRRDSPPRAGRRRIGAAGPADRGGRGVRRSIPRVPSRGCRCPAHRRRAGRSAPWR